MIKEIIKSGNYPAVLLVFGEEDFLVQESAQKLYDAASAMDATQMNCEVMDAESAPIDKVLGLAKSFPMMSDKRVIWVKHCDRYIGTKDKKAGDVLAEYLTNPMPSTFLLLTATLAGAAGMGAAKAKSPDGIKRKVSAQKYPFNKLLEGASWIEFPAMKDRQLSAWLVEQCKSLQIEIEPQVVDFLVMRTANSVRELNSELEKVLTFIGDKKKISEDDVLAVVGTERSNSVFELQRAFGRADAAQTLTIISKMMSNERQEMLILTMLARYFVALLKLIDVRGSSDRQLMAKTAGIPPFAVGDHLSALDALGPQRVERALHELRKTEAILKSTSTDPLLVLQTMVANILRST
ncbi:MAG: DNA polymerase III subunit delta [Ignavibacteria bacterium]|nr:DNA polymerase III subunit delta [Ignavibacteria bacterium]